MANKRKKARPRPPRVKKGRARASPVLAVAFTDNGKTGPIAITYVCQQSCPTTCKFRGGPGEPGPCYAEHGHIGRITRRLNEAGVGWTPIQIAHEHARAIATLPATADLRLCGVGDHRTNSAALVVSAECELYIDRSAFTVDVYGYTHAWWIVHRSSWGRVSMLASVDSLEELDIAWAKGYACALVVEDFETDDGTAWKSRTTDREYTMVPCPHQTRDVQCIDCRMCMDDTKLRAESRVIVFRAHGSGRAQLIETLGLIRRD